MGFEDILKRICRTWNLKVLFPKSSNNDIISNNYAQCFRLYRGVTLSLDTNPSL